MICTTSGGVRLEVGRGVHLRRLVIVLQGGLERIALRGAGARRVRGFRLLSTAVAVVVGHQTVVLFGLLLAAPDSPGNKSQGTQDDGTTDTHNHTDDGVPSLGGHARSVGVALVVESRSQRRHSRAGLSLLASIAVCLSGKAGGSGQGLRLGRLVLVIVLILVIILSRRRSGASWCRRCRRGAFGRDAASRLCIGLRSRASGWGFGRRRLGRLRGSRGRLGRLRCGRL